MNNEKKSTGDETATKGPARAKEEKEPIPKGPDPFQEKHENPDTETGG